MRVDISRTEYTCDECQKANGYNDGWFALRRERGIDVTSVMVDLCSAKCLLAFIDKRREVWVRP